MTYLTTPTIKHDQRADHNSNNAESKGLLGTIDSQMPDWSPLQGDHRVFW